MQGGEIVSHRLITRLVDNTSNRLPGTTDTPGVEEEKKQNVLECQTENKVNSRAADLLLL